MRAAGAVGVQNGAWLLPRSAKHAELVEALADDARSSGGSAVVLDVTAPTPETETRLIEQFRGDRAREFDEFAERAAALLAEIARETERRKFSFAELEEIEVDLEKLVSWLDKITGRDFFPDARATDAVALLGRCRDQLDQFARAVYRAEGVEEPSAPPARRTPSGRRPRPHPTERDSGPTEGQP